MKLIMEPVSVAMRQGRPATIEWRRKRYTVLEVLEMWRYRGKWWMDETLKGDVRTYFRVRCDRADVEIYEKDGAWTLSRVMD